MNVVSQYTSVLMFDLYWLVGLSVAQIWLQVPLKSAKDQCDDVVEMSADLDDSSESLAHQHDVQDTWHW